MSTYDLIIRNGLLVDPVTKSTRRADLAIASGKIAAIADSLPSTATAIQTINAANLYVTPGLVDLHTHCFWGTFWGVEPDPIAATTGVTTWIDAGSAGAYNFSGFRRFIIDPSQSRVFAFLHISGIGLTGPTYESHHLGLLNVDHSFAIIEANRDIILGIKIRLDSAAVAEGTGMEALRRARELADRSNLPIMVHIGKAPPSIADIAPLLRRGDIITHCCTGHSNRLVDLERGTLLDVARELREKGVVFDLGHGWGSFSYPSAEVMLMAGVPPDVISTDVHQLSVQGPMYDMPTTLSKYINMGMGLEEVIARATVVPAGVIGRPDLGRLEVGGVADVAVFELQSGEFEFKDADLVERKGDKMLVNIVTIVDGKVLQRVPQQQLMPWVKQDDGVPGRLWDRLKNRDAIIGLGGAVQEGGEAAGGEYAKVFGAVGR
ncbi:amidohydrolase [Jimgerdemannia flammicorona]|uniref:Amidohydrolase n=1 Tax=Jimgerdemannia flammicorona TaxID=994334 RepID=A0A433DD59_9FUNG|nr:amidohydrolase [Jimgerdemannia flammicorona]